MSQEANQNKENNEDVKPEEKKAETEVKPEAKPSDVEKLTQQLSFLQADLAKAKSEEETWKNKYYEAFADLANTRKALDKDHENMVRYRAQGFVEKIIPTLDSFEMALAAKQDNPEVAKYLQGYNMIHTQLEQALKEEGVSFVEVKKGDKFDANTMHAIQTMEGDEDNLIAQPCLKGYLLHDRLIRPAMVIVTVKKAEEKKDESKDEKKADSK
jgi:molecular chaperone GrpE